MRTINLDILNEGLLGITSKEGGFYAEGAKIALLRSGHQSGVILKISGAFEEDVRIVWTEDIEDSEVLLIIDNYQKKTNKFFDYVNVS